MTFGSNPDDTVLTQPGLIINHLQNRQKFEPANTHSIGRNVPWPWFEHKIEPIKIEGIQGKYFLEKTWIMIQLIWSIRSNSKMENLDSKKLKAVKRLQSLQ